MVDDTSSKAPIPTHVSDIKRKRELELKSKKKKAVHNPGMKDFTVTYDIDGTGKPKLFTVRAGEVEYFDPVVADHVIKHLTAFIYEQRDSGDKGDLVGIRKEIEVEI